MKAYTPQSTKIDLGGTDTAQTVLLSTSATKVAKGLKYGVQTGILYLSPASLATDPAYLRQIGDHIDSKIGIGHSRDRFLRVARREIQRYQAERDGVLNRLVNVCRWSSRGCRSLCLGLHSGHHRLGMNIWSQIAQVRRTRYMMRDPGGFMRTLDREIKSVRRASIRRGMDTAIRLDGTSDLWIAGRTWIAAANPGCTFYDYTKQDPTCRPIRSNTHLTYSVGESRRSWSIGSDYMDRGGCAAVVMDRDTYARSVESGIYRGYPVLDGDASDLRYLDNPGHVVALSAKGAPAIRDRTGFVHRTGLQVIQ
jgi:hypothetical protein